MAWHFWLADGLNPVQTLTLINQKGLQVKLLAYGARVCSIGLPVNGNMVEMTLGYRDPEGYLDDQLYLGATVGRVSNRIANAAFELNGQHYKLTKNHGEHCLHGGYDGFSSRFWQLDEHWSDQHRARFSLCSPDGDEGFPGKLWVSVSYSLTDNNRLDIQYDAVSSKDTVVNLCNHCYFHLGEAGIEQLSLQINSSKYLPTDAQGIPLGWWQDVANTPFDFSEERNPGYLNSATQQGFDHCYLLPAQAKNEPVAILKGLTSGVKLSVFSDQPALQFYSGQYLNGDFKPYQGVCLEAQGVIDACNQPELGSIYLAAGEHYCKTVSYQFDYDFTPAKD